MFLIIILIKKHAISNVYIKNYEIYLLIGVISLNFFKQALSTAINVINSNTNYLKSINNITPEILVMAGLFESIFSHFFDLILIVGFMLFYHLPLLGLILYPVLFFFFIILILGISFIFATIGVYNKDFNNVWLIITQILFFLTPVFYVIKKVDYIYIINLFNPLFYFLLIARSLLMDFTMPPIWAMAGLIIFGAVALVVGLSVFNKYKHEFSER